MADVKDMDLMREFVEGGSEAAFAELVQRHVNFVYSVALRYVGNSQDAQDATQVVFMILAQKAASLRHRTTLTGWLYETTRFTGARLARTNARQHAREQKAFMQSTLDNSETEIVWRQVTPLLEEAMARLGEKDRTLLALLFFENKTAVETAALLGIHEWAARKRSARALEKLRKFFAQHGINSTASTLAGAISAHSVQTAPALLAKTVAAAALGKGASAGGSTLTLAKATLLAMKTKAVVTIIAAAALILGAGALVLTQVEFHPPTASGKEVPQQFPNDAFVNDDGTSPFLVHVDPNTRRTPDSAPAIHIKYTGAADPKQKLRGACTALCVVTNGSPLMGKRVRVSSWLKTRDVQRWAGTGMVIIDKDKLWRAVDFMFDRPVRGTTDWQQIESVTDVPDEPCTIFFGPDLYSAGEIWSDDFRVDVVPSTTPITDNRAWGVNGGDPLSYSETADVSNTHGGHPAVCLAYTPDGAAPPGTSINWGQTIRPPDSHKYIGHTVRMTGWVKTENVSERLEPFIRANRDNGKILGKHSMVNDYSLKGTRDWTQFSVTCAIPKNTHYLGIGFNLYGG